jgi:CHAT domain-containing protein
VDVLHYCGHAFFDRLDRTQSGLILANDEILTAARLQALASIPRVMIFNACQAARMRNTTTDIALEAYSLAEMVLRSGVEAFLGSFWEVSDTAAEKFATALYDQLSNGVTLRESVLIARQKLYQVQQRDWANYCLYGDGRFQLA